LRSRSVTNAVALCTMVLVALTACDGANGADAPKKPRPSATPTQPSLSTPAPAPLSEHDRNALDMAKRACENRDFKTLFTAIAISPVVRRKYSARMIEVSVRESPDKALATRQVSSSAYEDFPITQVDFYYKPTKPLKAGDEDEYIDIEFNQSQSDQFSVDWARVHYDGQSDGGDDLGNIIGTDGNPLPPGTHPDSDGQLLFWPTNDCWQLVADNRWQR